MDRSHSISPFQKEYVYGYGQQYWLQPPHGLPNDHERQFTSAAQSTFTPTLFNNHHINNRMSLPLLNSGLPQMRQQVPAIGRSAHDSIYHFEHATHPAGLARPPSQDPKSLARLSVPRVLPHDVDNTQYEHVPKMEWIKAPTDYSSSPYSTADSPDSLPDTPMSPPPAFIQTKDPKDDPVFGELYQTSLFNPHVQAAEEVRRLIANGTLRPTTSSQLPSASPLEVLHHPPSFSDYGEEPSSATSGAEAGALDEAEEARSAAASESVSRASSEEVKSDDEDGSGERSDRDTLLLNLRAQGRSYKEIRRMGNFTEAESTLRGRYRMLTKDKSERVRKPQWKAGDVDALRQAVKTVQAQKAKGRARSGRRSKIAWKQVSEWMKKHGSSYAFAPATCAKKWEEVR